MGVLCALRRGTSSADRGLNRTRDLAGGSDDRLDVLFGLHPPLGIVVRRAPAKCAQEGLFLRGIIREARDGGFGIEAETAAPIACGEGPYSRNPPSELSPSVRKSGFSQSASFASDISIVSILPFFAAHARCSAVLHLHWKPRTRQPQSPHAVGFVVGPAHANSTAEKTRRIVALRNIPMIASSNIIV